MKNIVEISIFKLARNEVQAGEMGSNNAEVDLIQTPQLIYPSISLYLYKYVQDMHTL